jgi:hypothetical protein
MGESGNHCRRNDTGEERGDGPRGLTQMLVAERAFGSHTAVYSGWKDATGKAPSVVVASVWQARVMPIRCHCFLLSRQPRHNVVP